MNRSYLSQSLRSVAIVLIIAVAFLPAINGMEWTAAKSTSWLFAPGIHTSERVVAKYSDHYETSIGQLVQTTNDFVVVGSQVQGINFPEIVMEKKEAPSLWKNKRFGTLLNYAYNKITRWRNTFNDRKEYIYIEEKRHDGPEVCYPVINLASINLGQQSDIKTYSRAYDNHVATFNETQIVLYGVSRGAATTFNFLATEYQSKTKQHVKAVVLEGCFDSVRNLLSYKYPTMQRSIKTKGLVERIFSSIYSGHDLDGITPIDNVANFPQDLPIMLVTSKKDNVVPAACVWHLYRQLKEAGHQHVYILELAHSPHPRYMMAHPEDSVKYETAIHAFYKRYNVAYNPTLAKQGEELLEQCQP